MIQVSLHIFAIWSVNNKDSDQTDLSLHWAHM